MLKPKLKKIAFISHEASATGAPILLLNLIRLLISEYGIRCEIILLRGGILESEFSKLGDIIVIKSADYSSSKGFKRLYLLITSRLRLLFAFFKIRNCDFVFNNSIINGWAISFLKYSRKPILTYVHELHYVVNLYSFKKNVIPVLKSTQIFFYPCSKVKDFLLELGVANRNLYRLNYYFDLSQFKQESNSQDGDNCLQICGVGVASYRKGTDLFLSIANDVVQKKSNINFTWIGGFSDNITEKNYRSEVQVFAGKPSVFFAGFIAPDLVKSIYSNYHVLFLTSREDPYPLVVLEAAANKIPSIVFKDASGIIDFVNNDTGFVVDVNDKSAVVNLIADLTTDVLKKKGLEANRLFLKIHCNHELIIQQFYDGINAVLK